MAPSDLSRHEYAQKDLMEGSDNLTCNKKSGQQITYRKWQITYIYALISIQEQTQLVNYRPFLSHSPYSRLLRAL